MTDQVKDTIKKYLKAIGGIESVRKELRIPLIKECIFILNAIEKENLWDKIALYYPTVRQYQPIKINSKDPYDYKVSFILNLPE